MVFNYAGSWLYGVKNIFFTWSICFVQLVSTIVLGKFVSKWHETKQQLNAILIAYMRTEKNQYF